MRIMVWQELFWPHIGGVEVLAMKLLSALRRRGHTIVAVTRRDRLETPMEAEYEGITIYRYPFPWAAFASGELDQLIATRQQIADLKRAFRPDLVHMNSYGPSFLLYQHTIMRHPVPLLATLHTTHAAVIPARAFAEDSLLRGALRQASWVTCVSAAVRDEACRLLPEIASYCSVVYNGVETPRVAPTPLPFEPPRLLCLGRLAPEKGFDLALQALRSVLGRFPAARLIVAGDGPARSSLEAQAADLGLTPSVEFLGWVPPDDVPSLLNTATLVLVPSRHEGLPTVALEAAAMGRPVVATRLGSLSEIVMDRETGWLVEEEDPEGLAEGITFLLEHPRVAIALGEAAGRQVQERFSFERYVDAYDRLYQDIVERSPRTSAPS